MNYAIYAAGGASYFGGQHILAEMSSPTGVANTATLYARDNGAGKTLLCCKLGDNTEIVLATQA